MDFWDLSKPFKRIQLKNGQTQGYIKNCTPEDDVKFEKKPKCGVQYAEKYILQEKKEIIKLCEKDVDEAEVSFNGSCCADLTSTGTFQDFNEIRDTNNEQLYKKYFKSENKDTSNLSINNFKSKILSLVNLNEVTVISGPTGCGKTTKVPQYILDAHAENNKYCNIIVSQPRRIAAISIAKRVCQERGWPEGSMCGFKVGLIRNVSQDTRLTYVTVGVLLQILLRKKNMNEYTHVILDEIHERDQDTDFALLVVKQFLNWNSKNVKVILMSATADTTKFANYFEKPLCGKFQPAPVIKIEESNAYAVDIHYLEELSNLGKLPIINMEDPSLSDLHISIGIKLIKYFEMLDPEQIDKKSVLVFLPGIFEIEQFYDKLKDPSIYTCGQSQYRWHCVPLHSSITVDEQRQAFLPPPTGYRKIILATNIAESSITVPDVMFVIDFCLAKVLVTDQESNFTYLKLCWASKANLVQRSGRAGRVMNGKVYRIIYKDNYHDLDEYNTPDILRCPLEKLVLQAKMLDIGPPEAVLALAVDPPDLRDIGRTILILKEIGGLLVTKDGKYSETDGDLTFLGRLMAALPVDPQITKLIALGFVYNCLEECIVIGAAMSLNSLFSTPFQAQMKSYNAKLDWADGSCSDSIAFLNVYEVWKMNHKNGYFKRSNSRGELNWAQRHFVQLRTLKEVEILINEITMRLTCNGIEVPRSGFGIRWTEIEKALVLKFVIAGAFYPNYFTRGARGGQVDEREAVKTLGGRDPFTTVYLSNYPSDQPPDLYSHLIREKMSTCKENMKITYDSSKVFIEFHQNDLTNNGSSKVPGRILMAVYRAVKLRDTIKSFMINMLPREEAKKRAGEMQIQKRKKIFQDKSSQQEVDTNKMQESVLPGIDVKYLPISITYVVNPCKFWAARKNMTTIKHERNIFRYLNESNADVHVFSQAPRVGGICAAPYEFENSICLYRGRIDAIRNNEAKVFFIDYGNTQMVPINELREFGPKLLQVLKDIPGQAFQCTLTKVQPSPRTNLHGQWCCEAKKRFNDLLKDGELVGSIFSVVNGVISMVLFKRIEDKSKELLININDKLVEEGFCEVSEESYLSKMNFEIRRNLELDESQRVGYNAIQIRELEVQPPPPNFFSQECGSIPVSLRGPFSPLEMKVFSSTQGGTSKLVKIARNSVNSVLLDCDPQDPHERLIVAGSIGQNQSGTTLILHNTTIMPNIHGLAAIVPFVFAPTIELRVNRMRTMYTGLLCGLGIDEFGRSLFPEHDTEVIFDCEFTVEDLIVINKLRYTMGNLLLGVGYPEPIQGLPDFVKYQELLKESFTTLINTHRPSIEQQFCEKQFQWNLVVSDYIMSNPDILRNSKKSIFPIHRGVTLKSKEEGNDKVIENLTYLRQIVQNRNMPVLKSLRCELCQLDLRDQNFLSLHLASEAHLDKENLIFNKNKSC